MSSRRMIFVSGTWRANKAAPHSAAAHRVGQRIAEAGCSLGCGPGTGIARHAIDGFRSVSNRVGRVYYYLPDEAHMLAVGEEVEPGADEIVRTDLDYPMRNVYQIGQSAGLIVITGGDGALEEIVPALADYGLPVAALRGSGQAADALQALVRVFPEWEPNILLDDNPDELADFVLARATQDAAA